MENHTEKGHILCRAIIEIVGAPKEHIEKSLKEFVDNLKKREDYEIIKEDYAKAEPAGKMFSTFAEIELWIPDLTGVYDFCIEAMPSSIEVLDPSELVIGSAGLTGSLNDLLQKLHTVDMTIKDSNAKIRLLEKNSFTLATNIIALSLKGNSLGISELSKKTGIEEKKLDEFLKFMIKMKKVEKEGETYKLR